MNGRGNAPGGRLTRGGGVEGFLLLEVMAALVLLAVAVVPLATSVLSALEAATAVRGRDAALAVAATSAGSDETWGWGLQVVAAGWRPGPVLDVSVRPAGGTGVTVGLWVGGWFVGERMPEDDGTLSVEASEWRGRAGDEVVVRLRGAEGTWGPPWRSIVPAREGGTPMMVASDAIAMTQPESMAGDETVAHAPVLSNPQVGTSPDGEPVKVDPLGLFFTVRPAGTRQCELWVGMEMPRERAQSWKAEEERALDVYF